MTVEPAVVARATTSSEAELIVGYLRSAGVRAVVEDVQVAADSTTVGGELRVVVPAESAERARELLRKADHVDATDPGSDLDVGLPIDDDVREYLSWKAATEPAPSEAVTAQHVGDPVPMSSAVEPLHARHLPVLPLLGLVALVVALVVLLR